MSCKEIIAQELRKDKKMGYGYVPNCNHFTGKKKSKRKHLKTYKPKRKHINKYERR